MSDAAAGLERNERDAVRLVAFRLTDLAGRWRHTSMDAASVDAEVPGQVGPMAIAARMLTGVMSIRAQVEPGTIHVTSRSSR